MQIKILGYWITLDITNNPGCVPSIPNRTKPKPFREEICKYCGNLITSLDNYDMVKYGEPHCNNQQNNIKSLVTYRERK